MVSQSEKRRVAQKHMDAISADSGPVYGVRLIDTLPLGNGPMLQAMPTRQDLIDARSMSERAVAGYEVLLSHYRELLIYKEAMDSMAAQMIHPKMTGREMAEMQLKGSTQPQDRKPEEKPERNRCKTCGQTFGFNFPCKCGNHL